MPAKTAAVITFERIGARISQPLISYTGIRVFGGQSTRVSGAQLFTALGVEITTIRSLARHSGEAIIRYVADAPLKSLRADLGLATRGASSSATSLPFRSGGRTSTSAPVRARIRKLEAAMTQLEERVQAQAQYMVAAHAPMREYSCKTPRRPPFTGRNRTTMATPCGWGYAGARKRGAGPPYRIVPSLANLPSSMICERCMPTENAVAAPVGIVDDHELSGDCAYRGWKE